MQSFNVYKPIVRLLTQAWMKKNTAQIKMNSWQAKEENAWNKKKRESSMRLRLAEARACSAANQWIENKNKKRRKVFEELNRNKNNSNNKNVRTHRSIECLFTRTQSTRHTAQFCENEIKLVNLSDCVRALVSFALQRNSLLFRSVSSYCSTCIFDIVTFASFFIILSLKTCLLFFLPLLLSFVFRIFIELLK